MDYQALDGLFSALSGQLKRLYDECSALVELSLEKQGVLVAGDDHEKLKDVTARMEAQNAVVTALEKERMETAVNIAQMCGLKQEPVTVSMIAPYAKGVMGVQLTGEASRLNECLFKLREVNMLNRDLLEMKMSYASFMLDVFTQDDHGQSTLYGADGQENMYERDIISILDSEI